MRGPDKYYRVSGYGDKVQSRHLHSPSWGWYTSEKLAIKEKLKYLKLYAKDISKRIKKLERKIKK